MLIGHLSIGMTADIYRHVETGGMHDWQAELAPMHVTRAFQKR